MPLSRGTHRAARVRGWLYWDQLDRALVGVMGVVLEPSRPLTLFEEEVPRSGVHVERRWQLTRGPDGALHLWRQRRKRAGRGEGSSGLEWDQLEGRPSAGG